CTTSCASSYCDRHRHRGVPTLPLPPPRPPPVPYTTLFRSPPVISSVISPPPRFEVRKIIVADRSTRRLSPSVSVALSKIPSSNCHSASEAFSISSNNRKLSFSLSV